jgi:hypothetical protein
MLASGIRFNDCFFSEPIALGSGSFPRCAGLFVILVEDRNWAPKPFQPLCFGEFGNNAPVDLLLHEAVHSLKRAQGKALYLSVTALPFSTTAQRWALFSELVRAYNPPGQAGENRTPPSDLVQKLEELEKRHHEQTAQLMWLRASADHLFGVFPERRRIGFQPEAVPAV